MNAGWPRLFGPNPGAAVLAELRWKVGVERFPGFRGFASMFWENLTKHERAYLETNRHSRWIDILNNIGTFTTFKIVNYFTSCDPHHDMSGRTFGHISNIFWHSIWHTIWHSIWHSFWHSSWHSMVVVEVRQGTLGVDARGWGPGRGRKERRKEGRKGGRKATTNIKSNNPHLAGGEYIKRYLYHST